MTTAYKKRIKMMKTNAQVIAEDQKGGKNSLKIALCASNHLPENRTHWLYAYIMQTNTEIQFSCWGFRSHQVHSTVQVFSCRSEYVLLSTIWRCILFLLISFFYICLISLSLVQFHQGRMTWHMTLLLNMERSESITKDCASVDNALYLETLVNVNVLNKLSVLLQSTG